MKILAIDSSANVASAAILEDDLLIAEYTVNHKKTHSQTLMLMVDEIVKMSECELAEIDAIALAGGPGSFTGLRIGSASVKGLAMALDKPVVSIPTLEAMACNIFAADAVVCPMMDARREQVYTGIYGYDEKGELQVIKDQCAVAVQDILAEVNSIGKKVIFLGDGVPVYESIIKEEVNVPFLLAPANINRQRAASVGVRAFTYLKEGSTQTAAEHAPVYLRVSQAERERQQ